MTPPSGSRAATAAPEPFPARAAITRTAAGIGLYAGAFGIAFGAVATRSGLSVTQAAALSAVMCTGASQFALVGVLAAGGSPVAGLLAAQALRAQDAGDWHAVERVAEPQQERRQEPGDRRSAGREDTHESEL